MTDEEKVPVVIAAGISTYNGDADMDMGIGREVVRVLAEYGYEIVRSEREGD